MTIDFEEDSKQIHVPKDEQLQEISELAHSQLSLERSIVDIEDELAELQRQYKKLTEETLPEKMAAIGISEFKLSDGTKVEIKQFIQANISLENKDAAFEWLRDQGHDDIIKHEIKGMFGKGEDEEAAKVVKALTELGVNYTDKEFVHPMTLKAFVKEQIESGSAFPLDTFSVFIGNKSKIKQPKPRR